MVVSQPFLELIPDSESVVLQLTVTLLVYQPLLPSVPVMVGTMVEASYQRPAQCNLREHTAVCVGRCPIVGTASHNLDESVSHHGDSRTGCTKG
jgi:hypothetical protein